MRRVSVILGLAALLVLPALAQAKTVHCLNDPSIGTYRVVGKDVAPIRNRLSGNVGPGGCWVADAVAWAEAAQVNQPGSNFKHNLTVTPHDAVSAERWHYTWREVHVTPVLTFWNFTARDSHQLVTFRFIAPEVAP